MEDLPTQPSAFDSADSVAPASHPSQVRPRRAAVTDQEQQFHGFALIWALVALATIWQRFELVVSSPFQVALHGAMAVLSLAVLLRPQYTIFTALLGGCHMGYAFYRLPATQYHEMLLLFFSAAIVVSYVTAVVRERSFRVSASRIYASFAPPVRVITVAGILAIGLSRLNWWFLDAQSGPVGQAIESLIGSRAPQWSVVLVISWLVVGELALGVSLLVPSWRRFGVGFGLIYWACQGVFGWGEMRFLLPVWVLGSYCFLPSESLSRMQDLLHRRIARSHVLRQHGLGIGVMIVALLAVAMEVNQRKAGSEPAMSSSAVVHGAFLLLAVAWGLVMFASLIERHPQRTRLAMIPKNAAHYLVLAVWMLVLLSPYMGVCISGSQPSMTGFSVADDTSNHLLFPQLQVAQVPMEWVEIEAADDEYLTALGDAGLCLAWSDFVDYVQARPEISVSFLRGGERYPMARVGEREEFLAQNAWWVRKFIRHEPRHMSALASIRRLSHIAEAVREAP